MCAFQRTSGNNPGPHLLGASIVGVEETDPKRRRRRRKEGKEERKERNKTIREKRFTS